ncbi:MAG: hypothetical protein ACFFDH_13730 [Promethearchaeota archaeon]
MNEKRYDSVKIFGFKLNQTSALYLFILTLTSLIFYILTIYDYFLDLYGMLPVLSIYDLISFSISAILELIPFPILIIILIACLKLREYSSNENKIEINWYQFRMNETSAPILFLPSLFDLIGIFSFITSYIFIFARIPSTVIFQSISIILRMILRIITIIISFYTMIKCIKIRKKLETNKEISINENKSEFKKFFGFSLNDNSIAILFILSLTAIISINPSIFSYILNFYSDMTFTIDLFVLILVGGVTLLIFVLLEIYTLIFCLKWKRYHPIIKKNGITLFGFEIKKTSATILFFIALIGLIGFLKEIYRYSESLLTNSAIFNDFYILFITLIPPILYFIKIIVLTPIYIYIILRCLKVREMQN